MKEIPLTQGKVALVDDCDYEYLSQWKWYTLQCGNVAYAVRTARQGRQHRVTMHREILHRAGFVFKFVDHINHNGLDNRRCNLRPATVSQNNQNRRPRQRNNKSGAKGVWWDRCGQMWYARVRSRGKVVANQFKDFDEAVAWRDQKAKELHGEFAVLNRPV